MELFHSAQLPVAFFPRVLEQVRVALAHESPRAAPSCASGRAGLSETTFVVLLHIVSGEGPVTYLIRLYSDSQDSVLY